MSSSRLVPGLLAVVALAAIGAYLIWIPMNHDVAWYLYLAGWLWGGEIDLYRDVYEVNPPLATWFSVPAAALARATGLPAAAVFTGWVCGFLALSGLQLVRLLPGLVNRREERRFLLLGLLVLGAVLPLPIFGQREHLLWVTFAPYLVTAGLRRAGAPVAPGRAFAVGAVAGLTMAFKPVYPLPWLVVEILLLWSLRDTRPWRRPENLGVVAAGGAVAVAALALEWDYFEMVELALATYGGYDLTPLRFLTRREPLALGAAALLALGLRAVRPGASGGFTALVLGAGAGFLAAAFAQGKGWGYHLYPVLATAGLAALWLALRAAAVSTPPLRRLWVGGAVAALVALAGLVVFRGVEDFRRSTLRALLPVAREHAAGESIYFLSTSVGPGFPLVNRIGGCWHARFNCLWPLPGLYLERGEGAPRRRALEAMGPHERQVVDGLVDDLVAHPPRLLLVHVTRGLQGLEGLDFDLSAWLSADPRFAALLARYEDLGRVHKVRVLRLPSAEPAARCDPE